MTLSPAELLTRLNKLGHDNGIGRLDLVENRFVGMKSRGIYETPGGTILLTAHRSIESITLDREAMHLKDSLMPRYAEIIYNGFWFSPERYMLQALIDASQKSVTGRVRLKLYKGNVICIGRESPNSLYDTRVVTFEDDEGAYNQVDAQGFIKLNALRLRLGGQIGRTGGKPDRRILIAPGTDYPVRSSACVLLTAPRGKGHADIASSKRFSHAFVPLHQDPRRRGIFFCPDRLWRHERRA